MAERSNGKKSTSGTTLDLMGEEEPAPPRAARKAAAPAPVVAAQAAPTEVGGALFGGDEVDLDARHPADVPVGNFPAPSQIAQVDEGAGDPFAEDDPFEDTVMARMLADEPAPLSSPLRAAREEFNLRTDEEAPAEEPSMEEAPAPFIAEAALVTEAVAEPPVEAVIESPMEASVVEAAESDLEAFADPVAVPEVEQKTEHKAEEELKLSAEVPMPIPVPAIPAAKPPAASKNMAPKTAKTNSPGLTIPRRYTQPDQDVWATVEWELRTASIVGSDGTVVFEQKGVEIPKSWSQLATNVVVSKYFRGQIGTLEREYSVKQLIGRVADRILEWGKQGGYFASDADADAFHDELRYTLLHQYAAFNSPVWFNLGWAGRRQAVSACYINEVNDTMESILDLYKTEGMLFKDGSGSGLNLSTLRSSKEPLEAGGRSSGPISFMKGLDASAGSIKSGGSTRRAACMRVLDIDHPDVKEFIDCKKDAEEKAHALIDAGYSGAFNVAGGAYDTVPFQNANHSVRVTDDFMQAVEADAAWDTRFRLSGKSAETYRARDLMRGIAEGTWVCGDPGMQYDTTINDWHTCANTDRIYASNPCSEYMFLNSTACNLSSLNLMKFRQEGTGAFDTDSFEHAVRLMITAQEIVVGFASYPTPKIEQRSHEYRTLGLGYANLGALLMAAGLPYDSDAGRAYAGAVTALMTGRAYHQSAAIARDCGGPFSGFAENRDPMLRVMHKHRDQVDQINGALIPDTLLAAARTAWDETVELGERHGYRNAQSTVLAPTGCLVGDSLILTSRGLVRLQSLGDTEGEQWQPLDVEVATDEGPRRARQFYINGAEAVVTVETARGYRVQGTPTHRIKVVDALGEWQWRRFAEIRPGDRVPLMLGGMVGEPNHVPLPPLPEAYWTSDHTTFVPRRMTSELAEFVGYFMGDGSLHSKGIRLCVAQEDRDVVTRLAALGRSLFGLEAAIADKPGYTEVAFHSVRLTLWWEACGFAKRAPSETHTGKGYAPLVPDAVLHANDPTVYAAFVRGLFEADGTNANGYVAWTTTTECFSRDVQSLLLTLGFVTTRKTDVQPAIRSKGRWGRNTQYVLRLLNVSTAEQFGRQIGFLSARKMAALQGSGDHPQAARHDQIPLSRELVDLLAPANDNLRKSLLLSLARTGTVSRRAAAELLVRAHHPKLGHLLQFFYDEVTAAELGEEQMTYDLSVPENVTYVANGFVSHNTIGFLMDCDTTGIEPDIAIVKYKSLVGGGMMKIVNQTVPEALERLGYDEAQAEGIIKFIDEHDTIEGAPDLKPEHLPIFDCAFRPMNGTRSIHYRGHIKMMAAAQPFISGAISKTVNVPNDATPEDIAETYLESWKLGIKAVAIYRDGSKRTQPLNTSKEAPAKEKIAPATEAAVPAAPLAPPKAVRRRLPDERAGVTHKFSIGGHEGYLTVGLYPDTNQPGEIFIRMSKEGSSISGLMDSFATAISLALQYGVPLSTLVDKFIHSRFEPSGFTGNKEIPMAKSVMDYIFRYLALRFLQKEDRHNVGLLADQDDSAYAAPAKLPAPPPPPAHDAKSGSLSNGNGKNGNGPKSGGDLAHLAETNTAAITDHEREIYRMQSDAPPCPECGAITIRSGACYKCLSCGTSLGCS